MSTAPLFDESELDAFFDGTPLPSPKPVCTRKPTITISTRKPTALVARVADAVRGVSPGGWSWDITTMGDEVHAHGTDEHNIGAGSFVVAMVDGETIVSDVIGQERKHPGRFVWDGANTPRPQDRSKGTRTHHAVRADTAAVVVALREVLS